MKKSYKNLAIIFFLGISSGLPIVLILSTLKALLTDKGFDLKTIGFFSLAVLPYSLKIFFAPIIDSAALPILTKNLGQRRSWIILTQLTLAVLIFAMSYAGMINSVGAIALLACLIGFASASQDVVIDGYRIELIEKENQGFAASSYVYGYQIGMLISGAGALVIAEKFSWDIVYFAMALMMVLCGLITLFAEETRKNWQPKKFRFWSWNKDYVVSPFLDFTRHQRWYVIFAFVIFFKLGDAFAGSMTLPFLLKSGFSKIEIASIVKTFGLFATLGGVFIGGVFVRKIGIIKSLWIAGILQMASNLTFAYLAKIGYNTGYLYAAVFAENFSGGIGNAVFVAYLSGLCNVAFSATQYAILSSLASFSRNALTAYTGVFAEYLGWYYFFIFSTALAIPGLLFLLWLNLDQIITKNDSRKTS